MYRIWPDFSKLLQIEAAFWYPFCEMKIKDNSQLTFTFSVTNSGWLSEWLVDFVGSVQ